METKREIDFQHANNDHNDVDILNFARGSIDLLFLDITVNSIVNSNLCDLLLNKGRYLILLFIKEQFLARLLSFHLKIVKTLFSCQLILFSCSFFMLITSDLQIFSLNMLGHKISGLLKFLLLLESKNQVKSLHSN